MYRIQIVFTSKFVLQLGPESSFWASSGYKGHSATECWYLNVNYHSLKSYISTASTETEFH